jgi:hypothetical protein
MANYATQTHLVNPMVVPEEGLIAPGRQCFLAKYRLRSALSDVLFSVPFGATRVLSPVPFCRTTSGDPLFNHVSSPARQTAKFNSAW